MVYLDLAELPSIVSDGHLISERKVAFRSFLSCDHLFSDSQSVQEEVRELIGQQTGVWPRGPIRLLTQLRYFGYYFSPLNMFYVYDEGGERVEFVLAEVSNTPWNERHCYTLWRGNRIRNRISHEGSLHFSHPKRFHVSPFMGMDLQYCWSLTEPGRDLRIQLANISDDEELFSAGMTLKRRELTNQQLTRMTLLYPVITAQIAAAIYFQAFRLWWKKCPFYTHPKKLSNSLHPSQAETVSLHQSGRTQEPAEGVR